MPSRHGSDSASATPTSTAAKPARRGPACWYHRRQPRWWTACRPTAKYRVGDPTGRDPHRPMRPRSSRERVLGFHLFGNRGGATLSPAHRTVEAWIASYVRPTVFAVCGPDMTIRRRRSSGRSSILPMPGRGRGRLDRQPTIYVLAGSVFSTDTDHASRSARRLRTGAGGHQRWCVHAGRAVWWVSQSADGREWAVRLESSFETSQFSGAVAFHPVGILWRARRCLVLDLSTASR